MLNNEVGAIFAVSVMKIFSECHAQTGLCYHVSDDEISLSAECGDIFEWSMADSEPIETFGDVVLLQTCANRLKLHAKYETYYVGYLYAAHKREMRPQGPAYTGMSSTLESMFDVCGPERTDSLKPVKD